MFSGHCECGRVRFECDGEIEDFSHCHCSQCRRMHGAAFATYAGVPRKSFRYVAGESDLTVYASSHDHDRVFCSICGSNILVDLSGEPESLYISMSAVDGNPPHPQPYHIYVGSKAPWYDITDDNPKYDTEPPE